MFEASGIPAAVLVLEGFKSLSLAKKAQLGLPDFEPVIIGQAVGSAEVARAQGERAVPTVVQWITTGKIPQTGKIAEKVAVPAR